LADWSENTWKFIMTLKSNVTPNTEEQNASLFITSRAGEDE
jgi:hypothetical protein